MNTLSVRDLNLLVKDSLSDIVKPGSQNSPLESHLAVVVLSDDPVNDLEVPGGPILVPSNLVGEQPQNHL